jgi:hypothetical protein
MGIETLREELDFSMRAKFITGLPCGQGAIGKEGALETSEEFSTFAEALADNTCRLTKINTVDCVDERRTIALGDGTVDPDILANRVVAQLPGGLVLPVTKAAVAADLVVVRDAKDFTAAYLTMYELLTGLGYEDGGHKGCGASKLVEKSTEEEVEIGSLLGSLPVVMDTNDETPRVVSMNRETKRRRLSDGYYGTWSPAWHEAFLADKVPQNFSILADDPDDPVTHGHHSRGIYAVSEDGYGFAKNKFIDATGLEAFSYTVSAANTITRDIIKAIGGSDLERARLRTELGVDAPQVLNQLVVKGHPVFIQAA